MVQFNHNREGEVEKKVIEKLSKIPIILTDFGFVPQKSYTKVERGMVTVFFSAPAKWDDNELKVNLRLVVDKTRGNVSKVITGFSLTL